ncbi:MAG: hypothetical protein KBS91_02320 [Firmicutes bacterium]|nr:hypothetical protein [Candidatus Caballimonas caccae]
MFRITYLDLDDGHNKGFNVQSKFGAMYFYSSMIYEKKNICELKIIKLDDNSLLEKEDIMGKVNKFIQKL